MVGRTVRWAAQPELVHPMAVRLVPEPEPARLEPELELELEPEHPTPGRLEPERMPGPGLVPGHRPSNRARSQTRFDPHRS